ISFGAPLEDQMSIATSGDGLSSFEDEGSARLPPLGTVADTESDPELTAMLSRAAMSIGLEVSGHPVPSPRGWMIGFLKWLTTAICT
ncbi:hypothetical protein M9458_044029, partial [Cirrhinus mrigala]